MANTYTQIHIQTVFTVKYRNALILPEHKKEVFGYIGNIINNLGHKNLIVNGMPDHVHCLFGLNTKQSISDLMREVKANSSRWLNMQVWMQHKFEWQEGYGAFSYSKSQIDAVYKYILNQEEHHSKKTFRQEYLEFLKKFEIDHDEKYIFHEPV
jgi:putative transposase